VLAGEPRQLARVLMLLGRIAIARESLAVELAAVQRADDPANVGTHGDDFDGGSGERAQELVMCGHDVMIPQI